MADDLQALIDRATPAPHQAPDFEALAARSARRRTVGAAVTTVAAMVALVAGAMVLWPSPNHIPPIDQVPSAPPGLLAPSLPDGWQEVVVGGASLAVPADWQVEVSAPAEPFLCQAGVGPRRILRVDPSHPERSGAEDGVYGCPSIHRLDGFGLIVGPLSDPSSERVLTIDGQEVQLEPTTVNGLEAFQTTTIIDSYSDDVILLTIPGLDAWLYATDAEADRETYDRVLATIAPAGASREADPPALSPTEADPPDDCPPGDNPTLDLIDVVYLGERAYRYEGATISAPASELGPVLGTVTCTLAETDLEAHGPGGDGDATFLPVGTTLHALPGTDPGFRIAAVRDGTTRVYEIWSAPDAELGGDAYDIRGRVTRIELLDWDDTDQVLGATTDGTTIDSLVDDVLAATVEPEPRPSGVGVAPRFRVRFHLTTGPPLTLSLYPDDHIALPLLRVPPSFTTTVLDLPPP